MAPMERAIQKRLRGIAWKIALPAVLAFLAKRSYPKAALMWLVKRLLGSCLISVLPIPIPTLKAGRGSTGQIGGVLKARGCTKPLIVTDELLVKHGLVQRCIDSVRQEGCEPHVFDKVEPNPPSDVVEAGFDMYRANGCDSIVAFGGGSPMDTAKVIGAKVGNPMAVESYEGYFKATWLGLRPMPPFVAVPTTAGTGSETTVAAIITIKGANRKILIGDLGLVPHVAVLDPEVLEKLPKPITAATGMDALTHAVESFLGGWSSAYTRKLSLSAVSRIFCSLQTSYDNGSDLKAREDMLQASHEAGLAFTRANVGYVHAIAHQLGAMLHTPHGEANAMLLPHVLDFYLADESADLCATCPCTEKYCELAVAAGLADSVPQDRHAKQALAREFVAKIKAMNAKMNIPSEAKGMTASHVREVATRALREAHGELHSPVSSPVSFLFDLGYPTPKYMALPECEEIIRKILPSSTA